MIKRLESLRIPSGFYYYSVCFILLINFSSANIYHSNSSDDENAVNSDGMWQKEVQTMKPPKLSQGASRFGKKRRKKNLIYSTLATSSLKYKIVFDKFWRKIQGIQIV